MSLARAVALAACVGLASAAAGDARAEPSDPPTSAEELKILGDAAMDEGRPAEALGAYLAAARLGERPELTYNVGRAKLALGDFLGAIDAFERFERTAPEELRAKVHRLPDVLTELRAKVARVDVRVRGTDALGHAPPGARLLLDGAPLAPGAPARVNPGRHVIEAHAPDHASRSLVVELRPGEVRAVDVSLAPRARPLLARPGFWLATGAGAVVVAAVVTGLVLAAQPSPTEGSLGTFTVR